MEYVRLSSRAETRDMVDTFLGYDHNRRIADGAFRVMKNLSSDAYPVLSPRKGRGVVATFNGCTGIIMKDVLCRCEGTAFVHGSTRVEMGLSSEPKQLVSMGAYVIILPDRKYINTADITDHGDIDAEYTTEDATDIHICRPNGEEYAMEYVSPTEPEDPVNLGVWIDTSQYPNRLMQWSDVTKAWTQVTSSCIRLFSMGIGKLFQAGDGITISGISEAGSISDMNTGEEITEKQREQLEALEGAAIVLERTDNSIVIDGIMDARCSISSVITIRRTMPIMDFVVEHGNRLWGCRYGLDAGGEFVNILYASKLGDFKNWTCYRGIDTDSYYANVGSDGPFTGAIGYGYGGCVLFFKEHGVHAVYGDGPGSFQVEYTACRGVQKGSGKSLAIVDGVVYYKSRSGVCAYTGGLPTEIGGAFGDVSYRDAVGGSWKHKYYLSMMDCASGEPSLFAYDTKLGLWHREDNTQAAAFADCGEEAYLLSASGALRTMGASEGIREAGVKWSAQTGLLGIDHPDRKRLRRINVRLRLDTGSRFRLSIRYDSAGSWIQVCSLVSSGMRAYDFPVRVRRCDHMELLLEGEGPCEVYAIVKTYQTGSDRR